MEHDSTTHDAVQREEETRAYEAPRIEDYGTLVDLTAGKGDADPDWFGSWEGDGGGGGYS